MTEYERNVSETMIKYHSIVKSFKVLESVEKKVKVLKSLSILCSGNSIEISTNSFKNIKEDAKER